MSKNDLRLTVLDAVRYIGRFEPEKYGKKYRAALTETAFDLSEKGQLTWEIKETGIIFKAA